MGKQTIAILGDTGRFSPELVKILMKQDLRLLFVSEDEAKNIKIKERLENLQSVAEIEFSSCEREGCWEADIIAISRQEDLSSALIQKIKAVATQKIILLVSEHRSQPDKRGIENMLPYSNLVEIIFTSHENELIISGKNSEAKLAIHRVFENSGYQMLKDS